MYAYMLIYKHYVSLYGHLLLIYYRRKKEQPMTRVQLKQFEDEWSEFKDSQWKLLWNYPEDTKFFSTSGGTLMLELELASVIAEKVDNICLYCTIDVVCALLKEHKGYGYGKKGNIPDPWHWESPIRLQLNQRLNYQYRIENEFQFGAWYDSITVSVTAKLVMLKCTLNIINEVKVPSSALENEFGSLLTFEKEEKDKFTDVKISITNDGSASPVNFFAHKAILAARSPMFAKMFKHDLLESATSIITLSDIDSEVFKELLTYIYTGKAPNIKVLASLLLSAAEKYQLGRLKAMCERQMSYGLEVKNAAEILVLAHTCRANELKKNALMYIIKHRNEVRKTKDWEKVHDSRELLEELLDTALELATKSKSIPELLQKFPKN